MSRKDVISLLEKETKLSKEDIDKVLEVPPDPKLGDFAFPCFVLAKQFKKAPQAIAQELAGKVKSHGAVERAEAVGPYLNFFLDKNRLAHQVLQKVLECGSLYGSGADKKETVMIEYPAPNTNKPLHLGHARNMLLGNSICNILGFAGFKAVPVDLVNDRGVHICKSMLAYKKWGKGKEPGKGKKPDHFVGDYYVLYGQKEKEDPKIEEEAKALLKKWEDGDKDTLTLWKKMRKWALDGFHETYKAMGVHHKKTYYESELYTHGKELILEGVKKGVFRRDPEGAVYADLEKDKLGKKYLLRDDGTSIYITQDIYLAKKKFDDFQMDRSVYVVGNEQRYHFQVLFKLLEMLGMPFAKKCYHLSYGMISLPEGKMKSREGTVVDTDNLMEDVQKLAGEEIKKRHEDLSAKEVAKRSKMIGLGAIKFFILKYDPMKDFVYNPKESVSFEGETGPYVQYAHARICSIFRQAGKKWEPKESEISKFKYEHEKEHRLITLLNSYPAVIRESAEKYNPSLVAKYAIELTQEFGSFYQECQVLKADNNQVKEARLTLIWCTRTVLQSALSMLGIEAPEEM
ncbi:arginine--tRNA ligase [Candidatus Woesearchaeota archaeon]|nr:arginine--tRNA ligase [Candidatus Woesearchaeota archaeon]